MARKFFKQVNYTQGVELMSAKIKIKKILKKLARV